MLRTLLLIASSLALAPAAHACSCLEPSLAKAWNEGADLMEVEVVDRKQVGRYRYFLATVNAAYQGCGTPGERVALRTPVDGAACGGLVHTPGEQLLVESYDTGITYRGLRVLDFGLCGINQDPSTLTDEDRAFLDSRLVTCPSTGLATCADGTEPFTCFIDPCEFAPDCPDGACAANYCGGCNYEYFDAFGYEVCPEL
ncbi:MAG: hypothetical protein ACI8PZ_003588 [Myxococcota bacterium]|jgi:hypothetical protein